MLPRKFVFLFLTLIILLAMSLYFPRITTAQSEEARLIPLSGPPEPEISQIFPAHNFVIYGRAGATVTELRKDGVDFVFPDPNPKPLDEARRAAGIVRGVTYRPIPYALDTEQIEIGNPKRMPNLETFFEFGGTVELLTTDTTLEKYDIIMSELMWGVDQGLRDKTGTIQVPELDEEGNFVFNENTIPPTRKTIPLHVPLLLSQEVQWIEFYNATDREITADLSLLFTPFVSHIEREIVETRGDTYVVLDALSTLFGGRWELPGKSGRRPSTAFVSAYRNIDYDTVENPDLDRDAQLAGIPFGSYEDSWEETPDEGRRNTVVTIIVVTGSTRRLTDLPYIATPGTKHVPEVYIKSLRPTDVESDKVVINEVRNDTSRDNLDWIELKNKQQSSGS